MLIGVHLSQETEDAAVVRQVMIDERLNWRSFVDHGAIGTTWKPPGTPSFFIIDAAGVIRYKWAGPPGANVMDAALEKVIEEAELATKKAPE